MPPKRAQPQPDAIPELSSDSEDSDDEDGAMDQVLEELRTASIDELRVLAPNATIDYCRKLLEMCDWDVTAAACEMLVPPGAPPSPRQHAAQPQAQLGHELGRLEALRKNSA